MRAFRRVLAAYPTMIRVGFAEALAYRAELVVWMLTTTMPLVSLALWSAVAADGPVGAYDGDTFAAYFLMALLVRQVTGSWLVWQINTEVKSGALSQRLLKPVHPIVAYSADSLAVVPLRTAMCLPLVPIALHYTGFAPLGTPTRALAFGLALLGAWLINFFVTTLVGALAFFMESSTNVFQAWLIAFSVLSGYVVPLALFPPWLTRAAYVLPFRYTLALPTEIAAGTLATSQAWTEVGIQWAYVAGTALFAVVLFNRGLRRYGAYGA